MPLQNKVARPKKRTLVRWDDNLNELLLLTVQSVCNANSVKIPWAKVAKTMGHNATEGAIVQHLAKLRSRRVAADKDVPPPLKRGYGGVSTGVKTSKKYQDADELSWSSSDEDWSESSVPQKRRRSSRVRRVKSRPIKDMKLKVEDETDGESRTGSIEELLVPGAKFLELPGDTVPMSSPKKRRLVVLRYRNPIREYQSTSSNYLEKSVSKDAALYDETHNEDLCQQSVMDSGLPLITNQFDYWLPIDTGGVLSNTSSVEPTQGFTNHNQFDDLMDFSFDSNRFPGTFTAGPYQEIQDATFNPWHA